MTQMNTDEENVGEYLPADITQAIIGAAMEVHNSLGPGFLESVYETALAHELELRGLNVKRQYAMQVRYKDIVVGDFIPDLIVNDCVIVELKATRENHSIFESIVLNQLKVCNLRVALLLNFGQERLYHRRYVK